MGREDVGPSVDPETRDINYVSVSQIQNFDPQSYGGCNRAWYFERILGQKRPTTKALDVGSDVHKQIEYYEKTGDDTLGVIARQGKHWLLEPGPGLLIEQPFGNHKAIVENFKYWRWIQDALAKGEASPERAKQWLTQNISPNTLTAAEVPLVGYIDVVNLRDYWLDNEGTKQPMGANTVEVHDHKTTSNIDLYAKSHLEDTVQMIGYAKWAHLQWPHLEHFRLSHGYIQTVGRGSEKRSVLVHLPLVQEKWARVEEQVARMKQVAREKDFLKIEPNYDSCNAYGRNGCPFKKMCPRDPERVLLDLVNSSYSGSGSNSNNGGSSMGLLDALNDAPIPTQTPLPPMAAAGQVPGQMQLPMQGVPTQGQPMQGQPMQGQPMQGQPMQGQPMQGQPMQSQWPQQGQWPQQAPQQVPQQAPPQTFQQTPQQAIQPMIYPGAAPPPPAPTSVDEAKQRLLAAEAQAHGAQAQQAAPMVAALTPAAVYCRACHGVLDQNNIAAPPTTNVVWHMQNGQPPHEAGYTVETFTAALRAIVAPQVTQAQPPNVVSPPDAPVSAPPTSALPIPPEQQATMHPAIVHAAAPFNPAPVAASVAAPVAGPSPEQLHASVAQAQAQAQAQQAQASSEAAVEKARTRKRKDATEAPTQPAPTVAPPAAAQVPDVNAQGEALHLYINVFTSFPTTDLESWVHSVVRTIAQNYQVPDIRSAPADSPLGYSKWKGVLAAAIAVNRPRGACSLNFTGESEYKTIAVEALQPYAAVFVRGSR